MLIPFFYLILHTLTVDAVALHYLRNNIKSNLYILLEAFETKKA